MGQETPQLAKETEQALDEIFVENDSSSAALDDKFAGLSWKPIPGYQVTRVIGEGRSGKVYEVIAPGGFAKAVKVVPLNPNNPLSERERHGLKLIRSVRHPYLLSIDRLDIEDDHLKIVMELADHSLESEYHRHVSEGKPGIPRGELLGLLWEAAEVLDLLNISCNLQHLDIKPGNLFITAGHIKVGDFGLVRETTNVGGEVDRRSNAVTPSYAAPELFNGMISQTSDQYSLACVYMETLVGKLPFTGTNARQLAYQHLTMEPDISALPEGDQPIIARSMSRDHEKRFKTCQMLISALLTSAGGSKSWSQGTSVGENEGKAGAPLLICEDGRASMSTCFFSRAGKEPLLAKVHEFIKEADAKVVKMDAGSAVFSFDAPSESGDAVTAVVRLILFQRGDAADSLLVETSVSCEGKEPSREMFTQFAENLLDLLHSYLEVDKLPETMTRKYPRKEILRSVTLTRMIDGSPPKAQVCTAVDVSAMGLGLVSPTPIEEGEVLVTLEGDSMQFPAHVVHCRRLDPQRFQLGVLFKTRPNYPEAFLRDVNLPK